MKNIMQTLGKSKLARNLALAGTLIAGSIGCGEGVGKAMDKEYFFMGDQFDQYTNAIVLDLERDYVNQRTVEKGRRELSFPRLYTSEELSQRFSGNTVYFDGMPIDYGTE